MAYGPDVDAVTDPRKSRQVVGKTLGGALTSLAKHGWCRRVREVCVDQVDLTKIQAVRSSKLLWCINLYLSSYVFGSQHGAGL